MVNVFFDMDGVLAKWNKDKTIEDTFVPGYFHTGVEPEIDAIDAIKEVSVSYNPSQVRFFILSARYDDEKNTENRFERDKIEFLKDNALGYIPICFVSCGCDKKNALKKYGIEGDYNLLFDDHTPNIKEWEFGSDKNIGIKWLNDVNGSGNSSYKSLCVPACRMDELGLEIAIKGIINHYIDASRTEGAA